MQPNLCRENVVRNSAKEGAPRPAGECKPRLKQSVSRLGRPIVGYDHLGRSLGELGSKTLQATCQRLLTEASRDNYAEIHLVAERLRGSVSLCQTRSCFRSRFTTVSKARASMHNRLTMADLSG